MTFECEKHGFQCKAVKQLEEIHATMYELEYKKNGARLIWLDREEENKTFAIAFKTIPQDDTGVFHILEHSVLSGSEKYPVKEPFVEMLKGSLYTFLNAYTYSDMTMYPVASRNEQDFLNLMDVYLDAVFHPLSLSDPHAFYQEGWHYELEAQDGELQRNGVVYNEMKGSFTSYYTVLEKEMNRLLYPDTPYQYVSGGHPEHIPKLTYENYLRSHQEFYHPSNAWIFLDGTMDLEKVLEKLDGVLGEFEGKRMEHEIVLQQPVTSEEKICYYEIDAEESEEPRTILAEGRVFGTFEDTEKIVAFSILAATLWASNESPMVKPFLEDGLAEDVEFGVTSGALQPYVTLVYQNCEECDKEEIWEKTERLLWELCEKGLDHEYIHSVIQSYLFSEKEKDYSKAGLTYAEYVLSSSLYGGDPSLNFFGERDLRSLDEKVELGYFEDLLREMLEIQHKARICMRPSTTIGEEKREKEREELQKIMEAHDEAWAEDVAGWFRDFRDRQNRPDTRESLATLPKLTLKDIPEHVLEIPEDVTEIEGRKLVHHPLNTNGIIHLELFFDLSDQTMEEMHFLELLSEVIGEVETEHYDTLTLSGVIQQSLGRFGTAVSVFDKNGMAMPYFVVYFSLLEERKEEALEIIREVFQRSKFRDEQAMFYHIRQEYTDLELDLPQSGDYYALIRLSAECKQSFALAETYKGIEHFKWLQYLEKNYEKEKGHIFETLTGLYQKIFSKERLMMNVTGEKDEAFLKELIDIFSSAPMGEKVEYACIPVESERYVVPADVSFASMVGACMLENEGVARVAACILSLGHLWNEVRVKGGAYGTKMAIAADGLIQFSSFRDPNPENAIRAFRESGRALRAFCESEESLEQYIISAIADTDPLLTIRSKGSVAMNWYIRGEKKEKRQQRREEILRTTKEDLVAFSYVLDQVCETGRTYIIGR